MKSRKLIYYPSFSVGALQQCMKKNEILRNGLNPRFYSADFPDQWRFPYFLLSAVSMKHENMREEMGMDKTLVIGDSGGFQLAMGTWKWSEDLNQKVLTWLENNSDIAMVLDIPPRAKYETKFNEAIDISYKNFKYFADNQTGKTKFINVLHGSNELEYEIWYNKMKDFEFNGFSIGGAIGNVVRVIFVIAMLIERGELDKKLNRIIHVLGISSGTDFFILSALQHALNKRYGTKIQLSTDSSSPSRITGFGSAYFGINWKKLVWIQTPIKKESAPQYDPDQQIICAIPGCPACQGLTYKDLFIYDSAAYSSIVLHNLFVYTESLKVITELVKMPDEMVASIINTDAVEVRNIIFNIINSEFPVVQYNKFREQLMKFGSMNNEKICNEKVDQFFKFE